MQSSISFAPPPLVWYLPPTPPSQFLCPSSPIIHGHSLLSHTPTYLRSDSSPPAALLSSYFLLAFILFVPSSQAKSDLFHTPTFPPPISDLSSFSYSHSSCVPHLIIFADIKKSVFYLAAALIVVSSVALNGTFSTFLHVCCCFISFPAGNFIFFRASNEL